MEALKVMAPGKVILHGEHAVVYGKRAIAVSVGLNTIVTISPSQTLKMKFPEVCLDMTLDLKELEQLRAKLGPDFRFNVLNESQEIPVSDEVKQILGDFTKNRTDLGSCDEALKPGQTAGFQSFLFLYLGIFDQLIPLSCSIETELPVGAGLGSSASFAVALAGGLLLAAKREKLKGHNVDTINRWAFVSEKFVHGSPSGVDNSVASFGGGIVFKKGEPIQHIVDCPDIHVLLVNTKVPRSTKTLVAKVATLKESNPKLFEEAMDEIDVIVGQCVEAIEDGRGVQAALIRRNQELLCTLGVSHPSLDLITKLASSHGFSAKLTGAGGGGCAFIFIPDGTSDETIQSLKSALQSHQLELWDTVLGCKGFTT